MTTQTTIRLSRTIFPKKVKLFFDFASIDVSDNNFGSGVYTSGNKVISIYHWSGEQITFGTYKLIMESYIFSN